MFFQCDYCKFKFKIKKNLDKHMCDRKSKFLLLDSPTGQVAYLCYQNWRSLKGFFAPSKNTFVSSRYFKSFINFIDFCNRKSLPEKNGYIKLMVEKKVEPSMWLQEEYYEYYIANFDQLYSPLRQVEISLEYLYRIADLLKCNIEEVFQKVSMVDILKLVYAKRVSPWLLLFMKSFQNHIKTRITEDEGFLLESLIDSTEWDAKVKANPEYTEKIKQLMVSLNI